MDKTPDSNPFQFAQDIIELDRMTETPEGAVKTLESIFSLMWFKYGIEESQKMFERAGLFEKHRRKTHADDKLRYFFESAKEAGIGTEEYAALLMGPDGEGFRKTLGLKITDTKSLIRRLGKDRLRPAVKPPRR